jgi:hypothetical protein
MLAWRRKWLPQAEDDAGSLGMALWLEKQHWQGMEAAVTRAIGKAFSGK